MAIKIHVLRNGNANTTIELDQVNQTLKIIDDVKNSGYTVYDIGGLIEFPQFRTIDGGTATIEGTELVDGGEAGTFILDL